ncbi:hypothetical protein SPFL3102_03698 [Sporomusaceae bacterium FL31]|nr:hypothetical protein SPFL3101_02347 [Sporomusaceae bacterium FL31]GCE35841.1 hypothetical protein SPFL3102_03698 [Sporomusaceae bacterium]
MKSLKATALLFVFGLCLFSAQAAFAAEVTVRTWFPSLDGKVQKGTTLDFEDNLGIEDKNLTSVGLSFGKPSGKLQFDYDSFSFDGTQNPAAGYTFNGIAYNPADRVKATTELTYIAAKWLPTYNAKNDRNFSWLFGVSHSKIKTKMEAPGKNTNKTFKSFAPIIGARYEIGNTTPTSYYGEIAASVTSGNKYSYASEIGVKRNISKKAGYIAGYRYLAAKSGSDDEYAKLSLSGPFLQINYHF